MHGPGGLRYYAAIWANDQAEDVNPFFAFLGDDMGNRSAMNAFRLFARYINLEINPFPVPSLRKEMPHGMERKTGEIWR